MMLKDTLKLFANYFRPRRGQCPRKECSDCNRRGSSAARNDADPTYTTNL